LQFPLVEGGTGDKGVGYPTRSFSRAKARQERKDTQPNPSLAEKGRRDNPTKSFFFKKLLRRMVLAKDHDERVLGKSLTTLEVATHIRMRRGWRSF
jgi:hypothetical protein